MIDAYRKQLFGKDIIHRSNSGKKVGGMRAIKSNQIKWVIFLELRLERTSNQAKSMTVSL
jgi:hypothetical protein